MHYSKDTFTTNPLSISASDSSIMKDGSLVQLNATAMDTASKRNFVWMKVLEARPANNFIRTIAQNVHNGLGTEQDVCIRCEVWQEWGQLSDIGVEDGELWYLL